MVSITPAAAVANSLTIWYEDENGRETSNRMHTTETDPAAATIQALVDAMKPLTEARVSRHGIEELAVVTDFTTGAGPYDMSDKLILVCSTTSSRIAKVAIPCPKPDYLTDDDILIVGDAAIVALFAAIQNIWEFDGDTLVELLRGYRLKTSRD